MQPTMIAGIVVALLLGIAVGYAIAPGGETVTQPPVTTTVTSTVTQTETQVMVETKTAFKTVTNTVTAPVTITTTETITEIMNPMPPLEDLQKGVVLRLKVGSAAGNAVATLGLGKIAVIAQSNLFCIQLGSVLASTLNMNNETAQVLVVMPGSNEATVASTIVNNGFNAVVLAYGGNSPAEEVTSGFKSMVSALRDAGFKGALIVHAAAFAGKALHATVEDTALCGYLRGINVYVYLPKPDAGVLELHKVALGNDCAISLEKIGEVPLG